ncbi:hypothetical protein [Lelliottia amnigena]|uniref:hypothetical protein n=1 Tax=Lelliottia amnigena TaxID=61646 RepID=UPI001ED95FC6|nr:hypothetical protein [Lelliottia amnigena]
MSVQNENAVSGGETLVRERSMDNGVYASLFEKINLTPATGLSDLSIWQDTTATYMRKVKRTMAAGSSSLSLMPSLSQSGICLSCLLEAAENGAPIVIKGE